MEPDGVARHLLFLDGRVDDGAVGGLRQDGVLEEGGVEVGLVLEPPRNLGRRRHHLGGGRNGGPDADRQRRFHGGGVLVCLEGGLRAEAGVLDGDGLKLSHRYLF